LIGSIAQRISPFFRLSPDAEWLRLVPYSATDDGLRARAFACDAKLV
jgi:hypothetical protein